MQQAAVLVGQGDGQAVDLRLGHQGERVVLHAEEAAHPRTELVEIGPAERVVQAQHRHAVGDLGEPARRLRADPAATGCRAGPGWGTLPRSRRCAAQRVVFGVGDLRRVFGVVEPVVLGDLGGQPFQFGGGLLRRSPPARAAIRLGHCPFQLRRNAASSSVIGWFTTRSGTLPDHQLGRCLVEGRAAEVVAGGDPESAAGLRELSDGGGQCLLQCAVEVGVHGVGAAEQDDLRHRCVVQQSAGSRRADWSRWWWRALAVGQGAQLERHRPVGHVVQAHQAQQVAGPVGFRAVFGVERAVAADRGDGGRREWPRRRWRRRPGSSACRSGSTAAFGRR